MEKYQTKTGWIEIDIPEITASELERMIAAELRQVDNCTQMVQEKPTIAQVEQSSVDLFCAKREAGGVSQLSALLSIGDDALFVQQALLILLRREPGAEELCIWLGKLSRYEVSRTELISQVRYSAEGRAAGVHISGLWPRAVIWQICQIPLLGSLVRLGITWIRLPELLRRLHEQRNALATESREHIKLLREHTDELRRYVGVGQDLDTFYAEFEQAARGSREEICERQRMYLPYAEQAAQASGCRKVVDVGAGRGEWLELLREAGFEGQGAELNSVFVKECRNRKLDAVLMNGISLLQTVSEQSLCMITAFQVAEHVPFVELLKLMREARRTLKPGGLLVIETPNPMSLRVGSCTFYADPTHQRPLVPDTLSYLLLSQGFPDRKLLFLNPPPDQIPWSKDDALAPLVERWNAAQDYAVIATRPADPA